MQENIANELVGSIQKKIARLRKAGFSKEDAEDAIGQACLKLVDISVKSGGSAAALVGTTLKTVSIDLTRKSKRVAGSLDDENFTGSSELISQDITTGIVHFDDADVIMRTLGSLGIKSPIARKVLYAEIKGFSNKEGAIFAGITVCSYKGLLNRTRADLLSRHSEEKIKDIFQNNLTDLLLNEDQASSRGLLFSRIFQTDPNAVQIKGPTRTFTRVVVSPELIKARKDFVCEYFEQIKGKKPETFASAMHFLAKDLGKDFRSIQRIVYGECNLRASVVLKLIEENKFKACATSAHVLANPASLEKHKKNEEKNQLISTRKQACDTLRSEILEFKELNNNEIVLRLFGYKGFKQSALILSGLRHVATKGKIESVIQAFSTLGISGSKIEDAIKTFAPPSSNPVTSNTLLAQRMSTLKILAGTENNSSNIKPVEYARKLFNTSYSGADQIVARGNSDLGIAHSRTLIKKLLESAEAFPEVAAQIDPSCFYINSRWYKRLNSSQNYGLASFRKLLVAALILQIKDQYQADRNNQNYYLIRLERILSLPSINDGIIRRQSFHEKSPLDGDDIIRLKALLVEFNFNPEVAIIFTQYGTPWCTIDMVGPLRQRLSNQLIKQSNGVKKTRRKVLIIGGSTDSETVEILKQQLEKQPDWMRNLLDQTDLEHIYRKIS